MCLNGSQMRYWGRNNINANFAEFLSQVLETKCINIENNYTH